VSDQLVQEVRRYLSGVGELATSIEGDMHDLLQRCANALESSAKDAARYRWLRSVGVQALVRPGGCLITAPPESPCWKSKQTELWTLDAAIDAALSPPSTSAPQPEPQSAGRES
jgi:hypothetical protein